jgi:hypothetical protein
MKVKKIINYLLQFSLIFFTFTLIFLLIIDRTIFNSKFVINNLNKTNYYETLDTEIKNEMDSYILQSGLDDEVLNNLYDKTDIINNVNESVEKVYLNEEFNVDTTNISKKLESNINEYLNSNNIIVNDNEAIDNFTNQMVKIYQNKVTSFNNIPYLGKILLVGSFYLKIIMIIVLIIDLSLLIILVKYYKEDMTSKILLSNGMLLTSSLIYLYNRLAFNNINLISSSMSSLLSELIKNFLFYLGVVSISLFILGIFTTIIKSNKGVIK